MSKHTKGPWSMTPMLSGSENDKGFCIRIKHGKWIADIAPMIDNDHGDASEEGKANAVLIQHAPDLLEAAKKAKIFYEDYIEGPSDRDEYGTLVALIATAEGESK